MVGMRRLVVTLALVLVAGIWPAAPAVAHGATAAQPMAAGSLRADFNNDGAEDLAVGVPGEDVGSAADAGAVNVLYGTAGGLTGSGSQLFTQVGSPPSSTTCSAARWRPGTSTMTASRIWRLAPHSRTPGARPTPGRSACCTARRPV
jgi:hypothetical protein